MKHLQTETQTSAAGPKPDPPAPLPQRRQDTEAAAMPGSPNSGTQTWSRRQSGHTFITGRRVLSAVCCELKMWMLSLLLTSADLSSASRSSL